MADNQNFIECLGESEDIKEITIPEGHEYHLFLSHSSKDEPEVIPILEVLEAEPYNLKCCIDRRDFMLGETVMDNINYALSKSMATVFFLTPNFIASDYCNHEKQTAYSLFLEGEGRVIPVILQPCNIPDDLRTVHYIDEPVPKDIAQRIYRCLTTDPADFKKLLPLNPIQAGLQRINGNKFSLLDITSEDKKLNEVVLTPHINRQFEKHGIKVTEKLKLMIPMVNSLPLNKWYYHKQMRSLTIFAIFASVLKALLLGNSAALIATVYGIITQSYEFNIDMMPIYIGVLVTCGVWPLLMVSLLIQMKVDITVSKRHIKKINHLSIPDCNCCFHVEATVFGSGLVYNVIKYDINQCKEHLNNCMKEINQRTEFEVIWNEITNNEIFSRYITEINDGNLPHVDEVRHMILNDKVCFCQYVEIHNTVHSIIKTLSKQREYNYNSDSRQCHVDEIV